MPPQIEHLEERLGEKLLHCQAQPGQRGYVPGTHQRATLGVGKNGYGVRTLVGNWQEEQCDVRFNPKKPSLITDQEKLWQSESTVAFAKPKLEKLVRDEDHLLKADQLTHTFLSNRSNNPVLPGGHKASLSLPGSTTRSTKSMSQKERLDNQQWATEQRSSFTDPAARTVTVKKVVSGMGKPNRGMGTHEEQVEEITKTWTRCTPLTLKRLNDTENRRAFMDWTPAVRAHQQKGEFLTRKEIEGGAGKGKFVM